ncbi:MAG: aldo/keto reductase [Alphaproteobacteria bacterium]
MSEMLTRKIGRSGISASAVGLGTWAIGGWMWGGADDKASIDAIHASMDAGITFIDTAPAYGMGRSEEIVGRAIKGRRDKIVLATKCGLIWHLQKGNYFFSQKDLPVHRFLGRDSIRYEVEQSLRRLGTDYIDHYITHWQDQTTEIDETMDALIELKNEGKILSIGASNCSVDDIKRYYNAGQLDSVQEEYSLLKRNLEKEIIPYCSSQDISVIAYSSLALGLLSGKIGPERIFDGDDLRKENPLFSQSNRHKIKLFMDSLKPLADVHKSSEARIIIAWTLSQKGVSITLCGARNPQQAIENASAGYLRLQESEISEINKLAKKYLVDLDT